MSLFDSALEVVQPYKNIKEMFEAFSKGDVIGGAKNYFESIPGVIGVTKFVVQGAPKVFVPSISKTIQVAATKAANWYTAPAKAMLKKAVVQPVAKVSSHIGGVGAALKATSVIGGVVAIDHTTGRLTGSGNISLLDAIKTAITGKPDKFVQQRIDNFKKGQSSSFGTKTIRHKGVDYPLISIGGQPLNVNILKILRPSLFK